MAWKAPALTKATTATRGTNNFALSDPSTQGPYRTDVQANVDGSLPTGSTVHYQAWRTTTTGDAEFEEGWGTYTLATRVVTRTAGNVIDGSAGPGVLVDFGLSGQMDVFFLAVLDLSDIPSSQRAAARANLDVPGLNTANTFTGEQVLVNSAAGVARALSIRNLQAASTANRSRQDWVVNTDTNPRAAFRVDAGYSTLADASRVSVVEFRADNAGTEAVVFKVAGHTLLDGSGNKYVAFPTGGTVKMLFAGAPGADWTRSNETNPSVIRLATAADSLNATGGSSNIFSGWSTAGHTLTEAQIPAHTHSLPVVSGTSAFTDGLKTDGDTLSPSTVTGSTGGGGSHSHNMTTPHYRIAAWYTFN